MLQSHSRPEEDWSIRSKRQQDKFLCYQVVYKRTVSIFSVVNNLRPSTNLQPSNYNDNEKGLKIETEGTIANLEVTLS